MKEAIRETNWVPSEVLIENDSESSNDDGEPDIDMYSDLQQQGFVVEGEYMNVTELRIREGDIRQTIIMAVTPRMDYDDERGNVVTIFEPR